MRVKLFIDGHNFYNSLLRINAGARVDYDALATALVKYVGGTFAGAHYYTSVVAQGPSSSEAFMQFLRNLELRPGYFVRTGRRAQRMERCPACQHAVSYYQDRGVDTRLSVEMTRYAARGNFDTCILLSGDEDFVPAIEAVNDFGLQAWVGTWGTELSPALRAVCFGHINLRELSKDFLVRGDNAGQ